MIALATIALLLAAFGLWILRSINQDITALRKEAKKYKVQAQDAHAEHHGFEKGLEKSVSLG